ncbi:MAG: hypothetical protein Q7T37_01620 [bacterium]|nr:hypothetical protein [bacterium]
MNAFTHRALFSALLFVLCFGLAGCPEIGGFSRAQSVTSQDELTLQPSASVANFIGQTTKIAGNLGYKVREANTKKQIIVFVKKTSAQDVGAVLIGGWSETSVRLTLQPDKIVIEAQKEGNFGQVETTSANEAVDLFKIALTKEFGSILAKQ